MTELIKNLKEQAQELLDLGDSHEKCVGRGMMNVLELLSIPQKGTRVNYFNVESQGWSDELQREEIQINCGENGKLNLIKTDEGFIVDVYDVNDENINTMIVYEDDINPLIED